jgi:tetratricopeptide (TPR) repeat protein
MTTNRRLFVPALLAAALLLTAGSAALAQIPDEFTNLQVFPKNTGKQDLVVAMRNFSMGLGVRCTHCHVSKTEGDTSTMDWASDDLPTKKDARRMMQMVATINTQLLPEDKDNDGLRVQCVTCHRGLQNPDTLDKVLMKEYSAGGVEASIASYKLLREKYYGSGSFDFGPYALIGVAEKLAQRKGDMDAAVKIMELNVEQNPTVPDAHLMLGQLQAVKGDKAGAIASVEAALKLDPDNAQARQTLNQLKPPAAEGSKTE